MSPEVYRCIVRNIGDAPVHEVRLDFSASFFPDGKPTGSSRASQRYSISIPRLAPEAEYVLYVRNDSPLGVIMDIPDKATVRVTPGADSVSADLKWDAQNIPDHLPSWGLSFNGVQVPGEETPK
jgi:hypothetical protein